MLKTVGFPSTRTGNQTIIDGNLIIGTSGRGIDFSATPGTGTSELFNDYEEGTFTPVLRDNAGAGNAATTTQTIGRYAKIGRYVFFNIALINITTTGLTVGNQIVVTGLPFSSANVSSNNVEIATTTRSAISATTGSVTASIINNGTHMTMLNQTTTGIGTVPVSAITSGSGQLWLSGKYEAA
jgi:hypothetical protein